MTMKKLRAKPHRFTEEYLIDLNATQAAIRAGYSPKTARQQGQRLLTNASIMEAIQAAMKERSARTDITQDRVMQELALIGFADMGDFVRINDLGNPVLDLTAIPEDALRIVSEITQDEYVEGNGEGAREVKKTRIKLHPKIPALVSMGKHLGMFVEKRHPVGMDGEPIDLAPVYVYAPDTSKLTADQWVERFKPKRETAESGD